MTYLHHFFQILPIVLACFAAISCSLRFSEDRRSADRTAMVLGVLSSLLLILAQTSWWSSYLIENSLQGTIFANYIWSIFNSLVMITLIAASSAFRKND